jgi:hypothetical protein
MWIPFSFSPLVAVTMTVAVALHHHHHHHHHHAIHTNTLEQEDVYSINTNAFPASPILANSEEAPAAWSTMHHEHHEYSDNDASVVLDESPECKRMQCFLCRSTVKYIHETLDLPNASAVAKGAQLTCGWLAHRRQSPTCATIMSHLDAIKHNVTHETPGRICRALLGHPCPRTKGKHAFHDKNDKRDRKCAKCVGAVRYVNATRKIDGLPTTAVAVGVNITCRHDLASCGKIAKNVPGILTALQAGKRARWICQRLGFCYHDRTTDETI